jgi:hypothetical protein
MKSFREFLAEKKGFKRVARDLGATILIGSHLMGSSVGDLVMKGYDKMFPEPWKELQPYLTKHPFSGKLTLDEDKLDEDQKKRVYKLLAAMQARYTPKNN